MNRVVHNEKGLDTEDYEIWLREIKEGLNTLKIKPCLCG